MRQLTERQAYLLEEVAALGPITTLELAEEMGETVSVMRSMLKRLEARGLVESSDYVRRVHRLRGVDWMIAGDD